MHNFLKKKNSSKQKNSFPKKKLLLRLGRGVGLEFLELRELLPRRGEVELAELLVQLHGLHHHHVLLVIVPHLGVASEGELLPQWVPLKAVVSENPPQIRVVGEEHPEHVPHLPLVPVGAQVHLSGRVDGRELVRVGLDTDARVEADRQKVVHDLKPVLPGGNIHGRQVTDAGELRVDVEVEEGQHGHHTRGADHQLQLVAGHERDLLNIFWETFSNILSILNQGLGFGGIAWSAGRMQIFSTSSSCRNFSDTSCQSSGLYTVQF